MRATRKLVMCVVVAGATLAWGAQAMAEKPSPPPATDHKGFREPEHDGPRGIERLLQVLKVDDKQRKKITELVDAQREKQAALRKSLRSSRMELRQAMAAADPDEKGIRQILAKRSELEADMVLSRVHLRSEIKAVLTPEQRELAERIRPLMGRDMDGQGGPAGFFRKGPGKAGCGCNGTAMRGPRGVRPPAPEMKGGEPEDGSEPDPLGAPEE